MRQLSLAIMVVLIMLGLILCLVVSGSCATISCSSTLWLMPFLPLAYLLLGKLTLQIPAIATLPTAPLRHPPRLVQPNGVFLTAHIGGRRNIF